jgi:hypothetical protein
MAMNRLFGMFSSDLKNLMVPFYLSSMILTIKMSQLCSNHALKTIKSFLTYFLVFIIFLVGNIPWQTTQEELQELFSRVGEAKFEIHREKGSNKPSGYGFVDFKDPQAAALAIQKFNGYEINGRELNVDYPSQSSKQTIGGATSSSSSKASAFAQAKARDVQRQRTISLTIVIFKPNKSKISLLPMLNGD